VTSSDSGKDLSKQQTLKEHKLVQLDKVLCKWFTAMHSEGKPVTGLMMIEKAKFFKDEMKITEKCTLFECSNEKLHVRTLVSICVGTV
jgi:hypothetical protein